MESNLSMQLSPYAISKYVNELYALTFAKCYSMDTIGLRYFNVYGPRQNPNGAYAAVIPRWINALLNVDKVHIYGDGNTSRDFCYIDDVVQANILAAFIESNIAINTVYNIASGQEVSLNHLYAILCKKLNLHDNLPVYYDFRKGDICRSLASINKSKTLLNYEPRFSLEMGLSETINWFCSEFDNSMYNENAQIM